MGVLLAGCGGGETVGDAPPGEAQAVLQTVRAYQQAYLDGDASAACEHMTGEAKREIVEELAVLEDEISCEGAVESALGLAGPEDLAKIRRSRTELTPEEVGIDGDRATVELPQSGNDLHLQRVDRNWYIADATPED